MSHDVAGLELSEALAPDDCFCLAGFFRHLCHRGAGGKIVLIELQQATGDEDATLEFVMRDELRELRRQVVPPPAAVTKQCAVNQSCREGKTRQSFDPPNEGIASRDRRDVPVGRVATFGP